MINLSKKIQTKLLRLKLTPDDLRFVQDVELTNQDAFTLQDLVAIRAYREAAWSISLFPAAHYLPAAPSFSSPRHSQKIPSNLPKFDARTDPRKFIRLLEATLDAQYTAPERWTRALQQALLANAVTATWAETHLSAELAWSDAKELFVSTYSDTEQSKRDRLELLQAKQNDRTVHEYGAQMIQLSDQLGLPADDSWVLSLFEGGLTPALRPGYLTLSEVHPPTTLHDAIRLARRVEQSTAVHFVPSTPSSASLRPKKRAVADQSPSSPFCSFHRSHTHSTEECVGVKRHRAAEAAAASGGLVTQPPAARSPSPFKVLLTPQKKAAVPFTPSPDSTPRSACRKCGKVGHWQKDCPGTPAAALLLTDPVEMEESVETPHYQEAVGFLLSAPSSSLVRVDVWVAGVELCAVVDSGCTHSMLSTEWVTQQKLPRQTGVAPTVLQLADGQYRTLAAPTTDVSVEYGSASCSHVFQVMDSPVQMLLGLDLMAKLGIGLSGLQLGRREPQQQDLLDEPSDLVDGVQWHEDRSELEEAIAPAIARNLNNPRRFCTAPGSVVTLTVSKPPPAIRQYRIPVRWHNQVRQQIAEWIQEGVVEAAVEGSPFNSPLLCVPKRSADGTIAPDRCRVCIDVRQLNRYLLEDDQFPLPLIEELLEALGGSSIYSAIDLRSAYTRLEVEVSSRPLLTFSWEGQQYQFAGAPFGIRYLPSHYQRMISQVLVGLREFALPYIDDIIVFSKSVREHKLHVEKVLNRLTHYFIPISEEKSKFGLKALFLLGHHISPAGVRPDTRKLAAVKDWPTPQSAKEVQSYIGLLNYFRRFIGNFAQISAPLDAVRKSFNWGPEQERAFMALKKALIEAPLLAYPDFSRPFEIGTDASLHGIAAVLFQRRGNTIDLISFRSRALRGGEKNYSATKLECLGVVFALNSFRYFVWGSRFVLHSDHRSLCWMLQQKEPNRIVLGWLEVLFDYDFTISYIPGRSNTLPDLLSRIYSRMPAGPVDTAAELPASTSATALHLKLVDTLEAQQVPEDEREAVLDRLHNEGHFGSRALFEAIRREGLSWPKLAQSCAQHVRRCELCARFTIKREGFHPARSSTALLPMDHIAVDTLDLNITSNRGHNYLLVIVDVATRFVFLRCLRTKSMEEMARKLFKLICVFGPPRIIQSDNGLEFANQLINSLTHLMSVERRFSTPYHPTGNGLVERYVQSSLVVLRKLVGTQERSWDDHVPVAQLLLNNHITRSHGSRPFSLFFGRAMNQLRDHRGATVEKWTKQSADDLRRRWEIMEKMVYPVILEKAAEHQRSTHASLDAKHKLVSIPVGARVMTRDLFRKGKLDPFYEGPFLVTAISKGGSYTLQDRDGVTLARRFPPEQLVITEVPWTQENAVEVEAILQHRGKAGSYEYLVKWRNYPNSENEWVQESDFFDTEILRRYWRLQGTDFNSFSNPIPLIRKRRGRPRLSDEERAGRTTRPSSIVSPARQDSIRYARAPSTARFTSSTHVLPAQHVSTQSSHTTSPARRAQPQYLVSTSPARRAQPHSSPLPSPARRMSTRTTNRSPVRRVPPVSPLDTSPVQTARVQVPQPMSPHRRSPLQFQSSTPIRQGTLRRSLRLRQGRL